MSASKTIHSTEEARARLSELRKDFMELREGERGEDFSTRAAALKSEVDELDGLIEINQKFEGRAMASGLAATANVAGAGAVMDRRSGGEIMLASPTFREWAERGCPEGSLRGNGIEFGLDAGLASFEQRANIYEFGTGGAGSTYAGTNPDASGSGLLLPIAQPMAPMPRQARIFMRDLLPVASTTMASIPYVQELSPVSLENVGVTGVAEGTTKPAASIAFNGQRADVCTLATTITISKQMFADGPAVVSYLNQRLPYLLKLQEDYQLLNGPLNNYPNLPGILNQPNIQSQAATPSGDDASILGNAFANIELADGAVTGVVMHPVDAWHMFIKRAAGGSGTFDAGTPFASIPMSVWGVPTYRTRAKTQGTALVADFQHVGQIFDRQQINMQIYQERYAEQNLALLLVEERLACAWVRPDLACVATLNG